MITRITRRDAIRFAATAALCGRAGADEPPPKLRALIVDGQSNHDWRSTTRELRAALEGSGRFSVDVATAPERPGPKAGASALAGYRAAMGRFAPDLARYAVVIDNYNGDHWPEAFRRSLVERVGAGRLGLVIVHAANHPFADWPEFNRMMGLGWRDDPKAGRAVKVSEDGEIRLVPAGVGPGATWDPKRPVTVTVRDRDHPITRGMPARWRHASDEVYHGLRGPAEGLHLLATYLSDRAAGGTGEHEPSAWTIAYGSGRVFVTPMGHDADGQRCPGFRALLARGAEWAATGSVKLALPEDFFAKAGDPR